jgi:prepilin-type N-terminal cleavage/methylation domain-containing protein
MFRLTARRETRAFTLLELIVVIVVLGVLAALAIPTFTRVIENSKTKRTETSLTAVMRDAQALAALDGEAVPTFEMVDTAFSESGQVFAATEGTSAATAFSVCDDARPADCSPVPGSVVVWYGATPTVGGLAARSGDICYLARVEGGAATAWHVDDPDAECTVDTAVSGPSEDAPNVAPPLENIRLAVFGLNGGDIANPVIDDLRVTDGQGTTGSHLVLSETFEGKADGPYGTGEVPTYVTSNPAFNTDAVMQMVAPGITPGTWLNPLGGQPTWSTPAVAGEELESNPEGFNGLGFGFTSPTAEASFVVRRLPSGTNTDDEGKVELASAGVSLIGGGSSGFGDEAEITVLEEGLRFRLNDPDGGDAEAAIVAKIPVAVGDRVALRRSGSPSDPTFSVRVNGTTVRTAKPSQIGWLAGQVNVPPGATECHATIAPAGDDTTSGVFSSMRLKPDGSWKIATVPAVPVRVRVGCIDAEAAWYAPTPRSDAQWEQATLHTVITGETTDLGTVTLLPL